MLSAGHEVNTKNRATVKRRDLYPKLEPNMLSVFSLIPSRACSRSQRLRRSGR